MEDKNNQKLCMKWWFWVTICIMFVSVILAIMPYPDSDCDNALEGYEETVSDLMECEKVLSELLDALDEYDKAIEDYCVFDYENPLCDALL